MYHLPMVGELKHTNNPIGLTLHDMGSNTTYQEK